MEKAKVQRTITQVIMDDAEKRGGVIRGFDDQPSISEFSDSPQPSIFDEEKNKKEEDGDDGINMSDIMGEEESEPQESLE